MILLTGATGKTGSTAARVIAEKGAAARALVRDEAKAAPLKDAGIELVVGDAGDAVVLRQAMTGVDRALLIMPNNEQQEAIETRLVDAAAEAGVRHIVKLSSMEASPDSKSPIARLHYTVEQHIRQSGLAWTMVRPNFFMQNLFGNAATIKSIQKFFLPLGDGKTAMSDARDVGAVIGEVMTGDGHEGQSYELTGPELLTFADVADRFSEVLGKKIEYVNQPMEEYRKVLVQFLPDEWHLNAVCALFAEIAEGGLDYTTDTVRELLGREPNSLKQFIQDHLVIFQD